MNHVIETVIDELGAIQSSDTILVAISGGVDSTVLAHCLRRLNAKIVLAHVNFNLRGHQSDEDQFFCEDLAKQWGIPIHIHLSDTKKYVQQRQISIQMAAREIRYQWFAELMEQHDYSFLAIAHHLDDSLETFLINLSRGTGLNGLLGITQKVASSRLFRPLLRLTKQEIKMYATTENIKWREDLSNEEEKYLRNEIRHQIVPKLKELHPNFMGNFQKTVDNLKDYQRIIANETDRVTQKITLEKNEGEWIVDTHKLKELAPLATYLHLLFAPYGFKSVKDIQHILHKHSGKQLYSSDFRMVKNRSKLHIVKKDSERRQATLIESADDFKQYVLDSLDGWVITEKGEVKLDAALLIYPLIIRSVVAGDYFYPKGMKGKRKKVSKLLKDKKLAIHQKEQIEVLINGDGKIIWVIDIHFDERFQATTQTQNYIALEKNKNQL